MQFIDIKSLKPHERNSEFFDDITDDNWKEFLNSVKSSGVIEPIVITQDKVIVSGHQRARASNELQLNEVPCRIKIFESDDRWGKEDWIIKELIETNLRQRGIGNTNPVKLARCIRELERLYGIKNGGDRRSDENNFNLKTQAELSNDLGMTQQQLTNVKRLLTLIPEIQSLVESGEMKATVAHKVWAKLPQKEQEQFLSVLGIKKAGEMSQKESIQEIERLKEELATEKSKPEKVVEVERTVFREVMPEEEKRRLQELESFKRNHGQRIKEIEIEKSDIEASLMESYARVRELERLEKSVKHERENPLYDIYRSTAGTVGHLKAFMDNERFAYDVLANSEQKVIRKLENELRNISRYSESLLSLISRKDGTVIVDVENNENNYIKVVE